MDKDINQDIIDIFIEEMADVQLLIEQHLPAWQKHLDDKLALQEIRRAYHTLKGSGKMVEADTLAELGFAFENALNQVIEGQRPVTAALQALVEESLQLLPDLLQDFVDLNETHQAESLQLLHKLSQVQQGVDIKPCDNATAESDEAPFLVLQQRLENIEQLLQNQSHKLRFIWLTPVLCGLILLAVMLQYFL